MLYNTKKQDAFTLIELLIVVAIIGILAAIAVPNFLNAQLKAKIARVQSDQRSVSTALEQYMLDWGSYVEDHDYPSDRNQRGLFRLTHPVAYMSSLPLDPFPSKVKAANEGNVHYEFGSGKANTCERFPANAYLIISPGPDVNEEVSGNDCFPNGTFISTFDVSNGLESTGDIVRMGGNYNGGRINMNGEWVVGGGPQ